MEKIPTWIDWLRIGTDISIDDLNDYLNVLYKQLLVTADDHEKKAQSQLKQLNDIFAKDEFNEFTDTTPYYEYWKYKEYFPRILLNSYHVASYTLLETEIISISRGIGKKKHQLFVVTDLGGKSNVKSASFYINRLTGIDVKNFSSWPQVEDGCTLRNNIVHANGLLTKKHEIDVARRYNLIIEGDTETTVGKPLKQLSITYDYNKSFVKTLREFFSELYKGLEACNHV